MEVQTEFLWDEKNYTEQKTNCENKNEQETSDTMNDTKISSTQVDWRDITDPKLRKKMRHKAWYEINKEKIKEKRKTYLKCNRDKIKQYLKDNKDKIKQYKKTWRKNNKEKLQKKAKIYHEINRDKINAYTRAYHKVNKNKRNRYLQNRCSTNIQYKLAKNLRSRLNMAILKNCKSGSAVKDLGCTIDELKIYLENKFQSGMTWDNWTINGWHIDHIKPLSSFDLTDRNQFLQACHYTNLQPLWAKDNLSKSDN